MEHPQDTHQEHKQPVCLQQKALAQWRVRQSFAFTDQPCDLSVGA